MLFSQIKDKPNYLSILHVGKIVALSICYIYNYPLELLHDFRISRWIDNPIELWLNLSSEQSSIDE